MTTAISLLNCDRRALPAAQAAFAASDAELVILFGSRARGDYQEGASDIDLLLVQPQMPTSEQRRSIQEAAKQAVRNAYQTPPEVQITWQTSNAFEESRRSINHMNARAVREGIIMPRNPENYPGEPEDYDYEADVIELRTENADTHHEAFENHHTMYEMGLTDANRLDRMAGKNAQEALEHGLKALIAANGAEYPTTHDLNELLAKAYEADPEFRAQFQPSINYDILNQYAGSADYQIPALPITEAQEYREAVNYDYERVRSRIRELTQNT